MAERKGSTPSWFYLGGVGAQGRGKKSMGMGLDLLTQISTSGCGMGGVIVLPGVENQFLLIHPVDV